MTDEVRQNLYFGLTSDGKEGGSDGKESSSDADNAALMRMEGCQRVTADDFEF